MQPRCHGGGRGGLEPALHKLAEEPLWSGYPRETLHEDLLGMVLELRESDHPNREELEDDVLEVMDLLVGWCAPSERL